MRVEALPVYAEVTPALVYVDAAVGALEALVAVAAVRVVEAEAVAVGPARGVSAVVNLGAVDAYGKEIDLGLVVLVKRLQYLKKYICIGKILKIHHVLVMFCKIICNLLKYLSLLKRFCLSKLNQFQLL